MLWDTHSFSMKAIGIDAMVEQEKVMAFQVAHSTTWEKGQRGLDL